MNIRFIIDFLMEIKLFANVHGRLNIHYFFFSFEILEIPKLQNFSSCKIFNFDSFISSYFLTTANTNSMDLLLLISADKIIVSWLGQQMDPFPNEYGFVLGHSPKIICFRLFSSNITLNNQILKYFLLIRLRWSIWCDQFCFTRVTYTYTLPWRYELRAKEIIRKGMSVRMPLGGLAQLLCLIFRYIRRFVNSPIQSLKHWEMFKIW